MRYSEHARHRMRDRGIGEAEVRQALANHDITYPTRDRVNRTDFVGSTDSGRRLKIVVADPDTQPLVVTVMEVGQ